MCTRFKNNFIKYYITLLLHNIHYSIPTYKIKKYKNNNYYDNVYILSGKG